MTIEKRSLIKIYIWLNVLVGAGCFASALFSVAPARLDLRFALLAAAMVALNVSTGVRIPHINATITISDAFLFLTVALFGGNSAVLLAALEGVTSAIRHSRKASTILFNAAVMSTSTFLATFALRFWPLPGRALADEALPFSILITALLVMALVQFVANSGLVAVLQAFKNSQPVWLTWKRYYLWSSLTYLAGALAAGVVVKLIDTFGYYAFFLAGAIIVVVYFTYQAYLSHVAASSAQAEQAERHAVELERYIAEREQAVEALRRSENDYRGLFEHAHDAILILKPEGETVLDVNQRACDIYGFSRAEFIGLSLETITQDVERGRLCVRETLEKGESLNFESVQYRRDGSKMYLEINAATVSYQNEQALLIVARDVSERRRAEEALKASEEQLRQAQKMEAVGQLAGGVAHDFNNLLTAIRGNCDFLLQDLEPGSAMHGDAEEIKKAADQAALLTSHLLAFSRKQILQTQVLNLNTVVETVSQILRRLIGEDIELINRLGPSGLHVEADPGRLEQVLINLVVNARDAIHEARPGRGGGRIEITTQEAALVAASADDQIAAPDKRCALLRITDNGCGMNEEMLPRVFEPFFTTKEVGKGTGLGLSTVYGIVKQSGGEVTVESEFGRGTTFNVFLPLSAPAVDDEPDDETAIENSGRMETVLLVEDQEAVRRIAIRALTRSGYRVLEAAGGGEALNVACGWKGPIDLLVTDVNMPRMGGRELAERLVSMRPQIEVIYTSGYTDDALLRQNLLSESVNFLQKPFSAAALTSKVRQVLDGN